MKKLQKVWNDMQDEERFIRRNGLSLYDFREFMRVCASLSHGESATIIDSKVKDLCDKYGFGVFREGIGWRIKLNKQPHKIIDEVLNSVYGDKLTEIN